MWPLFFGTVSDHICERNPDINQPFGSGIATIYDRRKMTKINPIKSGTQMTDLGVMIGRYSLDS